MNRLCIQKHSGSSLFKTVEKVATKGGCMASVSQVFLCMCQLIYRANADDHTSQGVKGANI